MPPAGNLAADRARAHYRWAQRYAKAGNPHKSITHMGRALDYDSSARAAWTATTASVRSSVAFGRPFDSVPLEMRLDETGECDFTLDGPNETMRVSLRLLQHIAYNCPLLIVSAFNGATLAVGLRVYDYSGRQGVIDRLDPESRIAVKTASKKVLCEITFMAVSYISDINTRALRRVVNWLITNQVMSDDSPIRADMGNLSTEQAQSLFRHIDDELAAGSVYVYAKAGHIARIGGVP